MILAATAGGELSIHVLDQQVDGSSDSAAEGPAHEKSR